ncbi:uncharacterized protein [Penaeus vannamei]|uniref:uncharacterized protein n=1 Tax=Penaeus vannamei TaxID=6689 RepID=UPI00387FA04A
MDELSAKLNDHKLGCYINDQLVNHLIYADDIVLFSPSLAGLQTLLNESAEYIAAVKVTLNTDETRCVLFNKSRLNKTPATGLRVNNMNIQFVNEVGYLGYVVIIQMIVKYKTYIEDCVSESTLRVCYNNSLRKVFGISSRSSITHSCVNLGITSFGELRPKGVVSLLSRVKLANDKLLYSFIDTNVRELLSQGFIGTGRYPIVDCIYVYINSRFILRTRKYRPTLWS